jgi:malonyl-CoA/methylmalonyl-CoA synthetase
VVAVIARAAQSSIAAGDIAAVLNVKLAAFKRPKTSIIVEELPRNAMGKVQKAELRSRYKDLFSRTSSSNHRGP